MKLKTIAPLEKNIERSFVRWCKQNGITTIKSGVPSWPDRFCFGPPGIFVMIEFKRPGKSLTINQHTIKILLASLGHTVYVCHSKEEAINAYREECAKQEALLRE
jgi:hypothetical protein